MESEKIIGGKWILLAPILGCFAVGDVGKIFASFLTVLGL